MSQGYVYILSNPAMPGMLKIGCTTRSVESRAWEIYQTGVPMPFEIVHEVQCPDCQEVEKNVHKGLDEHRVSASREFFQVSKEAAVLMVKNCQWEQVEEWLERFIPETIPAYHSERLDGSVTAIAANALGCVPEDICNAINHMDPDQLRGPVAAWFTFLSRNEKTEA